MQVSLHHHGEQGLIDPAPALQQRREELTSPGLRDPKLQIPAEVESVRNLAPFRVAVRFAVRS